MNSSAATRFFVILFGLTALLASAVRGQTYYSASTLGAPPGWLSFMAYGISNNGLIMGLASPFNGTSHAFIYNAGTWTDLGTFANGIAGNTLPLGINNSGQIAGVQNIDLCNNGGCPNAFLYSGGTMTDLGSPPPYNPSGVSGGLGLNDNGQVVGYFWWFSDTNVIVSHAFLYSGGTMTDLGAPPPPPPPPVVYFSSQASAINDFGEIVGFANFDTSGNVHASLYTGGSWTDLGTLPGSMSSAAYSINNSGQIVGDSGYHAFLYNGTMVDLGTLPGGSTSLARGINSSGQIVGSADVESVQHAFVYSRGTMTDLNSVVVTGLLPGEYLSGVGNGNAVNDSGVILGVGAGDTSYILTPCAKVCTSTSLASSLNPSTDGNAVTLTATVKQYGSGTPTGTVSFMDGGTLLGSVPLAGSAASFATATLSVGQHAITAAYSGDANFLPSAGNLSQTVNQVATNTIVISNLNPSTYKQALTFTASVSPASGSATATGTIAFKQGSLTLGSATLAQGSASLTPAAVLNAGTDPITASYSGDSNCLPSTGSFSQQVNQATITMSLKSNAKAVFVNSPVTFTASTTGQYGGSPTGTVAFSANAIQIGSPVPVAGGHAGITTRFAVAGTYTITAAYSGDANFLSGTATPLSETVYQTAPTTTSLKSSGSRSTFGSSVTFTATVRPTIGSMPNGEAVTFYDGTASIGTGTTSSGVAAFTTTSLPVGTNSITATYIGDANYQPSTSPIVKQVVTKEASTTVLGSDLNPSTYGQSVTFTAAVVSGDITATGTVTFKNGSSALGSSTLTGGVATFTSTNLAAGTDSITAVYGGDSLSLSSTSAPVNQAVAQAATTTTVASSRNPSKQGQSVTFTATVTATYATPTGTVTFTQGAVTLGTATLAAGEARFTTTALPTGSDTVTATYAGTADFVGSSGSVLQTVT
jgi:probable HAF family extracellular repeat protein